MISILRIVNMLRIHTKDWNYVSEHNLTIKSWYKVAVDHLVMTEHLMVNYALTWIDTTANHNELIFIDTKSNDNIGKKFTQTWLALHLKQFGFSMTMMTSLQDLLLLASSEYWEWKMIPQPVKLTL